MMRNKRNVFTWRKPRTIVRARQTFLFMVKRAIYDVPFRSGKENREIAMERFFPLQQKTREREEDFQDFATLNACVFGFRLSGKRTTPHNYSSYDSVVCARELLRARRRRDKLHLSV
jgi:hypothetical protein